MCTSKCQMKIMKEVASLNECMLQIIQGRETNQMGIEV